jgi:ABC-2 type transport system ATP-binding protein
LPVDGYTERPAKDEAATMTRQPAILTQGLVKFYGDYQALHGVDLEVERGEVFGFLGPNGAGKTTTIRCLLNQIYPDDGVLRVLGMDPQQDSVGVHARVGYLPGELHLEESMTVAAALHYLNRLRGAAADAKYIRKLAERLELDMSATIKNLSKGNKQKVGVIQALMHRPELLIMDEPTGGLDPLMQHEVLGLLTQARDEGATVFFSSHIMSEVEAIAERVGIIRQGKVVEVATTEGLVDRALRRVRIQFRAPVDLAPLARLPGVSILSAAGGRRAILQVAGEMDELIKALGAFPVSDLETHRPSLEEVFLRYYTDEPAS